MKKNVASQLVGIQLVSATDGSAVTTGTTTCYVTGDGGAQAAGSVSSGAATHKGNGYWEYAPAQAETNYDHVAFTFVNTSAVPATVQIWTSFPQTGDAFARLGAPAGASVSADVAAVKVDTAAIKVQSDKLTFTVANHLDVNVLKWLGGTIPAVNVTGVPLIDLKYTLGTISAGAAGFVRADSVTGNVLGSVSSVSGNVGGNVVGTVASVVGAVGSVTGNVGGNVTGSVGSVAAGGITAASIAADAITAAKIADGAIDANTFAAGAINASAIAADAITAAKIADGAIDAATFSAGAIDAAAIAPNAIGASELAADAVAEIAAGVRTELAAELARIDVATSTRASQTSVDTIDDFVDTEVAAIKAKTDNLPSDPADASDIAGAFSTVNATLATIAGYIDTEVAAIKAKTDNLPASPAATSDIPTAAAVADAVWDEAIAGHAIAGSTGEALSDAGGAGTPPTVGEIADEVQTRTIAAVTVVNGLAANTVTAAALAADAGTEIGTAVWASGTRTLSSFGTLVADIATAVWAATTRLLTAGTNIVLAKGTGVTGFNDLSAAQVNTEADTALSDAGVTTVRMAHLDADVSSRLATAGYTVPPTAAVNATAVRTELTTELARIDVATSTRLASGSYTAPDNAGIAVAAAAAASAATNAATLVGRLTSTRAGLLDNLDAAISTRAVAGDAMALTAAERGSAADKLLGRSLAGGADGGRTVQDALRALRNKTSITGGVLTVTQEDDATEAWHASVTTAPGDPLTAIDPA